MSVLCRSVALMIVKKANEKMNKDEIEKKQEQKLDISISNHEIWFLNFFQIYSIHNSWDLQKFCY